MASNKSALPSAAILILRLLTLALLTTSLAIIAADKLTADGDPPQRFTFRDVHAYRYLLAVAVVGCAYTLLLQLLLAAIAVARRNKQPAGGEDVAALVLALFADVAFAMLLAAGAAAGLGFTHDVKRYFDGVVFGGGGGSSPEVERLHHDVDRFFDMAYASAGLMAASAACTAVIIVISVYSLVK
ncbi:unnamed protein product [Urochloa humidicola]